MEQNTNVFNRFETLIKMDSPQRKITSKEYSTVFCKKKKFLLVFSIVGFLCIGANILLTLIFGEADVSASSYLVWIGIAELVCGVFYDNIIHSNIKKMRKNSRQTDEMICFNDVDIETVSTIQKANTSYAAITEIAETDRSYFLFLNKNAALSINKEEFILGSSEQFREFIRAKTTAPYKLYNIANRLVTKIIILVVGLVLGIGSLFLPVVLPTSAKTETFIKEEYSITLPSNVWEDHEYEGTYCLYNSDFTVFIDKYTFSEVITYFELDESIESITEEEFAGYYNSYYGDYAEIESLPNGYIYTRSAYTDVYDEFSTTYYYFEVFNEKNGVYYVSSFTCVDSETYTEYIPKFKEWAQTITIE